MSKIGLLTRARGPPSQKGARAALRAPVAHDDLAAGDARRRLAGRVEVVGVRVDDDGPARDVEVAPEADLRVRRAARARAVLLRANVAEVADALLDGVGPAELGLVRVVARAGAREASVEDRVLVDGERVEPRRQARQVPLDDAGRAAVLLEGDRARAGPVLALALALAFRRRRADDAGGLDQVGVREEVPQRAGGVAAGRGASRTRGEAARQRARGQRRRGREQ